MEKRGSLIILGKETQALPEVLLPCGYLGEARVSSDHKTKRPLIWEQECDFNYFKLTMGLKLRSMPLTT